MNADESDSEDRVDHEDPHGCSDDAVPVRADDHRGDDQCHVQGFRHDPQLRPTQGLEHLARRGREREYDAVQREYLQRNDRRLPRFSEEDLHERVSDQRESDCGGCCEQCPPLDVLEPNPAKQSGIVACMRERGEHTPADDVADHADRHVREPVRDRVVAERRGPENASQNDAVRVGVPIANQVRQAHVTTERA